ncbi:MAG TPA: dTDP-4-dehydrorhamnose 3,5-epimerase family protein [Dongiaceae bacterium]|jgi:dTDP-4-dehydrorhamnose 3,5-epimerase
MSDLPFAGQSTTGALPAGVLLRRLSNDQDCMGAATELYRRDWSLGLAPVQWNLVSSRPDTLRGVHVHHTHWDYLCVLDGEMVLGLHDMRPQSPTHRLSVQHRLAGDTPTSIVIPPGVAHGFYFAVAATHCYAVSHYWNTSDEIGCRWNDPMLGLTWPTSDPLLSPRDATAPSYEELARALKDQKPVYS